MGENVETTQGDGEQDLRGVSLVRKAVSAYTRLHAYSGGEPYALGSSEVEDWLHLSKDPLDKGRSHAELVGDLRHAGSHDYDISESPDLALLSGEQFTEVRLTHALDYVEYKNHADLLTWVWQLMSDGGRLHITTRDLSQLTRKKGVFQRLREAAASREAWLDTMRFMYSSGAPSDWFHACHTKRSLKDVLHEAGFVGIHVRRDGDLIATATKIDGSEK
jgi:hypothetical protein